MPSGSCNRNDSGPTSGRAPARQDLSKVPSGIGRLRSPSCEEGRSMAIRRHVAAAFGGTEEDFRRAFREGFGEAIDGVAIPETNGWHWLMASVWGVSGATLD